MRVVCCRKRMKLKKKPNACVSLCKIAYSSSLFVFCVITDWRLKSFCKDLRSKKKCFFPFIANIFDQSSDIGFIFGMYELMMKESEYGSDHCKNISALYLFSFSLFFFLFYRITSATMVFIGTKNIYYTIGQFLFEYMLYRSIYVNYRLKCKRPSSGQQWIQNMESMLEAFPQLILQMSYMIQTNQLEWFVMISIAFSMLSMVNKGVSEDKALFRNDEYYGNWQDAEWTNLNLKYLFRLLFRVFDISHRVLIIVIVWYESGGLILFILTSVELFILSLIVFKTKEFSFCFLSFFLCCKNKHNKSNEL